MKNTYFIALALFASVSAKAQDITQINDMMGNNNFREAKAAIDKYLLNPKKKDDAEGTYYKGRIYNALSKDNSVTPAESFALRDEAFAAFKKYQQLDPKDLFLSIEGYASYLDLYGGFYDLGAKEYNANNFDAAFSAFKKALEVKDYILTKKYEYAEYKLYPLDTSLVLNTAVAGTQANKQDEAEKYFRQLTDANVAGQDYQQVYDNLLIYYSDKGDDASFNALMQKAERFYPENEALIDLQLRSVTKKGDKALLYAKYEELIKKNPANFNLNYNYAVELYNSLYGKDAFKAGDAATGDKLSDALIKSIALQKADDISATMLMCNHQFNKSADLVNASNVIKGNKPEDIKKKADLKSAAGKSMDECIVYADKAVKFYESLPSKTGAQKANYKIVLSYLSDIYKIKNNKPKADEYDKKSAQADKL